MEQTADYHSYCDGLDPDDIVISGMSGRVPDCLNLEELRKALYNKQDLVHEDPRRFKKGTLGSKFSSFGLVPDTLTVDPDYFNLSPAFCKNLDHMAISHLEVCDEAIADAGYVPDELSGKTVGVYTAQVYSDQKELVFAKMKTAADLHNNCYLAAVRTSIPNQVSFNYNFKGPSFSVDSACSSSGVAMHLAFQALVSDEVEMAIVSGNQSNYSPKLFSLYATLGIVDNPLITYPFDSRACGMSRTEGNIAIILQKAKFARRCYAKLVKTHFITNGYVPEGILHPSTKDQAECLQKLLNDTGVSSNDVDYVEGHGTGTIIGDPVEMNAVAETFAVEGRDRPIYIGSIKSNIGHTEAASACAGVVKACFALASGVVPPNIKYKNPNPACPAAVEGKLKVVTEEFKLTNPYIVVSTFGITGTTISMLLKSYKKPENVTNEKVCKYRLVLAGSRTKEGLDSLLDSVPQDLPSGYLALLDKLSVKTRMLHRGFRLFEGTQEIQRHSQDSGSDVRPVWFVMSGMGSQWPGMGRKLMAFKPFADSMQKSAKTLKETVGLDLFELLEADSKHLTTTRRIMPAFITITAIQMALVDLLHRLKITPDGIVGHSHGELAAAYADGCVTAEEAIMIAYCRGNAVDSNNKKLINGAMAAVALSYEEVCRRLPKDVYVACDNGKESVTVSGTTEAIGKFVDELKKQKVLAKVVDVYGYSFHCPNINPVAGDLQKGLQKYIKGTRLRTKRFLSSSYPVDEWDTPGCQNVGAEYFVHNLTSLVRFKDAVQKIPKNAILLEIGPHSLLRPILQSSTGSQAAVIGLMKRNDPDNASVFLQSIGQFYCEGGRLQIELLYPPVKFPVTAETPMISQHIKFNRYFKLEPSVYEELSTDFEYKYDIMGKDSYLYDHIIDGRVLFPAAGLIELIWNAAASKHNKNVTDIVAVIQNFKIHRATIISQKSIDTALLFTVAISKGSEEFDDFSIVEGSSTVATGSVCLKPSSNLKEWEQQPQIGQGKQVDVHGKDIYSEIRINGMEHGPEFQKLHQVNMELTSGMVKFDGKFIPYVDAMLIFYALADNAVDGFRLPTGALNIAIDYMQLKSYLEKQGAETGIVPVSFDKSTHTLSAPGFKIVRLQTEPAVLREQQIQPYLEQYTFVPYTSTYTASDEHEKLLEFHMAVFNSLLDEMKPTTSEFDALLHNMKFNANKISNFELEKYLSNQDLTHISLLKILVEITGINLNIVQDRRSQFIEQFETNFGRDLINCSLSSDIPLRIMFDIIIENSRRRLNVLEVNISGHPIMPDIQRIVDTVSLTKLKSKTLVNKAGHTHWDLINMEQNKITVLEPTIQWPCNQDLVIGSFLFGSEEQFNKSLKELTSAMAKDGFLLLFTKQNLNNIERLFASILNINLDIPCHLNVKKSLSECGLITLASMTDCFGNSAQLLRRPVHLPATIPPVVRVSGEDFQWVDELKSVLYGSNATSSDTVWLTAEDMVFNGIIGMVNCLRQEPGGDKIRCVFAFNKDCKMTPFNPKHPAYQQLLQNDLIINVWNNGIWGSYRHMNISRSTVPRLHTHSYVDCTKLGDLSSFKWKESPIPYRSLGDNKEIVNVQYAALNFKDVMLATGKLNPGTSIVSKDCYSLFGLEFSGYDSQGRRVMGLTEGGALATTVAVQRDALIRIPDSWTMEQAATVPVVYATALYALLVRGNIQPGDKILIHSATGGVGLAACSIALSMNCEIFATVGNAKKLMYLREKFPQIKEENIASSRKTDFEQMILKRTDGKGVDVVLNSLADDKFQASVRCLGYNGRFLEIGKYDMMLDRNLGLKPFLKNITFNGVFLDVLQTMDGEMKKLLRLLQEWIDKKIIKPLDSTVFKREETEEAFRYMSNGIHVGKVLMKINDDIPAKLELKSLSLPSSPVTYFYSNKVYIIIGGLGGFGVELAKWLLTRGAKHIVLTSRFGARSAYHKLCLKRWKSNVIVSTRDVSKKTEAEALLQECMKNRPIGGIYNCAVVLKDGFLENTIKKDFITVCGIKAAATVYLDELTRRLCPQLDHFVCFSSISGGKGIAGQTNYGFANSVMERVCEQRVKDGLHGLAIQWGVIGDVGVVHRQMGDDARIAGAIAQPLRSCLSTLDFFMQSPYPVVASYVTSAGPQSGKNIDPLNEFAKIVGFTSASDLNPQRIIGEMGIDSIRAVEIRRLLDSLDLDLTTQEVFQMSISELKQILNEKEEKSGEQADKPMLMSTSVQMPKTLRHTNCCIPLHNGETKNKTPVFIAHIGDTDLEDIKPLANVFDAPTYALVWTKDASTSDLSNLSDYYIKVIEQNLNSNKTYHIAGHKMGGSLAVQIAIRSGGKCKSVMLLDASEGPHSIVSEDEVSLSEDDVLCHFVEQFVSSGITNLKDNLQKQKNTSDKMSLLMTILGVSGDEASSATQAAADFGQRLKIARSPIVGRLDGGVLMLEDPDVILANDIKDIVSSMSKICKGKVNVQRIIIRGDYDNANVIQKIKPVIDGFIS